jgi:hypothetical protein
MLNRYLCGAALLGTALIHLAVVPEHAREWPFAAGFFVVLAFVEVALALAVVRGAGRTMVLAGLAISAASAVLWLASRTVGLPIGPEAFTAEAIGAPDLVSTALEALAAVVFVRMARRGAPTPVPVSASR